MVEMCDWVLHSRRINTPMVPVKANDQRCSNGFVRSLNDSAKSFSASGNDFQHRYWLERKLRRCCNENFESNLPNRFGATSCFFK